MDLSYQIPRSALIWILLSVAVVLVPHSARMPVWISVVAAVCIVWRVLIFRGKLSYPSRWIRILIVLFTLAVSISQMRLVGIGLDSAAALLALGFVFKLIEMKQKRDIYVVISLCFVMTMVAFLYSQSIVATAYSLGAILVILGAMIALNRSINISDNWGTSKMAGKILLQAMPLAVVLFYVFPRIAPLWAVPIQSSGASTGVSNEMSPGDISSLGRSGDLAFRVQFENSEAPEHELLYWRGLVLTDFDGETWRRERSRSSFSIASARADKQLQWEGRMSRDGAALDYNIILEATQQPWVYGLHLAEAIDDGLFQSRNFELFNNGPVTQRLSYDLRSYLQSKTDFVLVDRVRRQNLELPSGGNSQSREFARQLRSSVTSDRDYVMAVLSHFSQNEYFYTLNPALLGNNRIDDFLFETREGFCEHYSSTFAYLMRAAGIPARVVIGYQGAELNPFENYMMVYQYNAHAWNEVWLKDEGWVRFDPTGAVSPDRVRLGVEAALRDDPAFLERSLFSSSGLGSINWINSLRLRLDALEYEWNRRVVNYDEDVQFELFEKIFGQVTEQKILFLLFGLASVVVIVVAFTVIRFEPKSKRGPVLSVYNKMSKDLEKIGLGRTKGEGPIAYRDRVVAARPDLSGIMMQITRLYVEISYQRRQVEDSEIISQAKQIKRFGRQLKKALLKKVLSI
ncbi:MAG: transglutaminase-like putative cysteine protease [Pseudohongiellaceae bacterium]|jgi:transglutaminase-like putative cysteine protease